MLWRLSLSLLAAASLLCSGAVGERAGEAIVLADRQVFSSIGATPTVSSIFPSSTSTTLPPSKSSSPGSGISTVSSTTITKSSLIPSATTFNSLELTTTFSQPPECTGGFTAVQAWGTEIYDNLIYSEDPYVFGYTTCFPPQFYNSVLASIASTTLPPFKKLICPATWENYEINSTYVICCPRGYGLIAPNLDDPVRPGLGAACSSYIAPRVLLDVTSFDPLGGTTLVPTTVGPDGTVVWFNGFDGLTTTGPPIPSSTSSLSSPSSSSLLSSSKTSSSSLSSSRTTTTPISTSSSKTSSSSMTSSSSSSKISTSSTISTTSTTSVRVSTTVNTVVPGESNLPACGKLCFDNMLAQYASLGCDPYDAYCLCSNVNFGYGLRDCSNGACGGDVASTVIAFGSAYCSTATATHIPATTTATTVVPGESNLPACGKLCFDNMLGQYASLGCSAYDAYCLCSNVNFGYGLRDCSNGACGAAVASTVIAFGNAYCSTATATHGANMAKRTAA